MWTAIKTVLWILVFVSGAAALSDAVAASNAHRAAVHAEFQAIYAAGAQRQVARAAYDRDMAAVKAAAAEIGGVANW